MEKTRLKVWAMLCFLLAGVLLYAQERVIIQLRNPSFEDAPNHSQTPREWIDCGFAGESEPDIQPSGEFGVTTLPKDGDTYLGMVTRDNSTWERVSQQLSQPLEEGKCYDFSIYLAKSPQYLSQSRTTGERVNYNKNVKLRIWGSSSPTKLKEILAESPPITSSFWKQFHFRFKPEKNFTYIIFEVFYLDTDQEAYNGNLLLDHASAITLVDCDKATVQGKYLTTAPAPIKNLPSKEVPNKDVLAIEGPTTTPPSTPKFTKGELLPLKEIRFVTGRSEPTNAAYVRLEKLAELLRINPSLMVEINVHLNHRYDRPDAEDLSLQRALAIEQFLIGKAVNKNRFKVRGLGNGYPLDPKNLSDDDERVEVKVLDF